MRSSSARVAANRANAARSTGPRTARGKAASSRNAVTHGAYASDDTLLALATPADPDPDLSPGTQTTSSTPPTANPDPSTPFASVGDFPPARPQSPPSVPSDRSRRSVFTPAGGSSTSYLATLTEQYQPSGPTELILVRRLAALALRIERLNDAIDALPSLGERRALVDHLLERYAIGESAGAIRDQPDWRGPLRRYDDPSYIHPYAEEMMDNPALDPDPATCAAVYTLSSRRAETFSRLETTAGRAFVATLNQLRAEQAARRRAESFPPLEYTPRQALFDAVDSRVRNALAAHGIDPDPAPRPQPPSSPATGPAPAGQEAPTAQNEAIDVMLQSPRPDRGNEPTPADPAPQLALAVTCDATTGALTCADRSHDPEIPQGVAATTQAPANPMPPDPQPDPSSLVPAIHPYPDAAFTSLAVLPGTPGAAPAHENPRATAVAPVCANAFSSLS